MGDGKPPPLPDAGRLQEQGRSGLQRKSTPDMFIIDKDGKIAYSGAIDNDPEGEKGDKRVNYVVQALDELLAGKPVTTPETKSYGCGVHYAE